jgi:hypothetical protein
MSLLMHSVVLDTVLTLSVPQNLVTLMQVLGSMPEMQTLQAVDALL